jgi:hypothetical protein
MLSDVGTKIHLEARNVFTAREDARPPRPTAGSERCHFLTLTPTGRCLKHQRVRLQLPAQS